MQTQLLARQRVAAASHRGARQARQPRQSRRLTVAVRAHEDEDVLPIWSGRISEGPDPEKLKWHSARLGGKTLGEELELMQKEFTQEEKRLEKDMHAHLYTSNWQGDVYVGSRWNILTVLTGLMFFVPVFGLLFAYLSYGTLWTGHYYGV